MNAFVLWVECTFPEDVVTRITRDDWKALAETSVYAQKRHERHPEAAWGGR